MKYAPSGSLILFAPHLSGGTITLGSQLVLNRNVTIDASDLPGGLTLSGGSNGDATVDPGETRHLRVENGAIVQLTALTLADGMAATNGGSIEQAAGELTVERCLFLRNRTLGSGGAIAFGNSFPGFLTIRNSTFVENNAALSGGAILAQQTAALLSCTITSKPSHRKAEGAAKATILPHQKGPAEERYPHKAGLKDPSNHAQGAPAMIDRTRILQFAQAVAREFQPERIVLFGSYAYGTPTEDSDVDLLVVMPHEGHPAYQAAAIELRVPPGFPLDLMVRSPERIREGLATGDGFVRDILERGSPLYESGDREVG